MRGIGYLFAGIIIFTSLFKIAEISFPSQIPSRTNVAQVLSVLVLNPQEPETSNPSSNPSTVSSGGEGGGVGALLTAPIVKSQTQKKKLVGDFNGDGKVNIRDFSILAYWYNRPLTPFAIAEGVDLNSDGKVTIADFSILAYYWTK